MAQKKIYVIGCIDKSKRPNPVAMIKLFNNLHSAEVFADAWREKNPETNIYYLTSEKVNDRALQEYMPG